MSMDLQPNITDIKDYSPFHSKITMEPFERGYGHTLGNALRRVILSAIPGFAATEVRIKGADQPYTSLPGIAEDVVEILLNLKGVSFKIDGAPRAEVNLNKKGPGAATAGDIDLPAGVHVLNPGQHLATLSAGTEFDMDITVDSGTGYHPATVAEHNQEKSVGVIRLDAAYSPVRNVAFDVEKTRVGDRTDLDRLVIDLKTTGVFDPEQIIRYAAKLLIERLQSFADLDRGLMQLETIERGDKVAVTQKMYESVDTLGLNVRVTNNLKQESIHLIGDLIGMTEMQLKKTPRLGSKSVDEIKLALAQVGLMLGMNVSASYEPKRP